MASSSTTRVPQPQDPTQTGFLDLAGEIRNDIYAYWAQDILHVGIRAQGRAHTTAAHPMTQVSHMVHREFLGIIGQDAALRARRVKVSVVDLDFYPLITYLNRVLASPEVDYHEFRIIGGRELIVELTFTEDFWRDPPVEKVARWFRTKRIKVPDLEYTLRVVSVADEDKTRRILDGMVTGGDPSPMWLEIMSTFRERGLAAQQAAEARAALEAAIPKPKTALEQAVENYYNVIYRRMDEGSGEEVKEEAGE